MNDFYRSDNHRPASQVLLTQESRFLQLFESSNCVQHLELCHVILTSRVQLRKPINQYLYPWSTIHVIEESVNACDVFRLKR